MENYRIVKETRGEDAKVTFLVQRKSENGWFDVVHPLFSEELAEHYIRKTGPYSVKLEIIKEIEV